uniref:Uncharacterized protein n=1 Tax=Romanomermis culicivorax TaxID=13658 RepID=A0A915L932_ROMCU
MQAKLQQRQQQMQESIELLAQEEKKVRAKLPSPMKVEEDVDVDKLCIDKGKMNIPESEILDKYEREWLEGKENFAYGKKKERDKIWHRVRRKGGENFMEVLKCQKLDPKNDEKA